MWVRNINLALRKKCSPPHSKRLKIFINIKRLKLNKMRIWKKRVINMKDKLRIRKPIIIVNKHLLSANNKMKNKMVLINQPKMNV